MSLPLFDDVVLGTIEPSAPKPPRRATQRSTAPPAPGPPMFELDDPRPRIYRPATIAVYGSPEYWAYWSSFGKGLDGQSEPGQEHDEQINRYLRDGFRLGQLARRRPPKD